MGGRSSRPAEAVASDRASIARAAGENPDSAAGEEADDISDYSYTHLAEAVAKLRPRDRTSITRAKSMLIQAHPSWLYQDADFVDCSRIIDADLRSAMAVAAAADKSLVKQLRERIGSQLASKQTDTPATSAFARWISRNGACGVAIGLLDQSPRRMLACVSSRMWGAVETARDDRHCFEPMMLRMVSGAAMGVLEVEKRVTDSWQSLGKGQLTQFMGGYRAVVCMGQLYVIGGLGRNTSVLADVVVFDQYSATWLPVAPLSIGRWKHTCEASSAKGQIYVYGGEDDDGRELDTVDIFDLKTGLWTHYYSNGLPKDCTRYLDFVAHKKAQAHNIGGVPPPGWDAASMATSNIGGGESRNTNPSGFACDFLELPSQLWNAIHHNE